MSWPINFNYDFSFFTSKVWNCIKDLFGIASKYLIENKVYEPEPSFKKSETQFADKVQSLLRALSVEKQEDEKNQIFHERLLSELKTILNF